ncbi:hypothetical protein [Nitrincola sp. A-D6]|uniref:hypothetical protein n=1 Tax=Nitrincola sp. A-D6 TaxID=1545442 RepID=UPI002E13ACE9
MTRLMWIKQPLAIHTNTHADGAGGLVVDMVQGVIHEVLALGERPNLPVSRYLMPGSMLCCLA